MILTTYLPPFICLFDFNLVDLPLKLERITYLIIAFFHAIFADIKHQNPTGIHPDTD